MFKDIDLVPEDHDLYGSNLALERRVEQRTAELTRALALVEAQKRALEDALRARDETQRQLQAELEDAHLLQGISAALVDEDSMGELYQRIVEAATLIMRSDFGTLQRYDEEQDSTAADRQRRPGR